MYHASAGGNTAAPKTAKKTSFVALGVAAACAGVVVAALGLAVARGGGGGGEAPAATRV